MPELHQYRFWFKLGVGQPEDFACEARSLEEAIARLRLRRMLMEQVERVEVWTDGGWQGIEPLIINQAMEEVE